MLVHVFHVLGMALSLIDADDSMSVSTFSSQRSMSNLSSVSYPASDFSRYRFQSSAAEFQC
jgi:hypothetical protein